MIKKLGNMIGPTQTSKSQCLTNHLIFILVNYLCTANSQVSLEGSGRNTILK